VGCFQKRNHQEEQLQETIQTRMVLVRRQRQKVPVDYQKENQW
jgi:hypothetical protein